MMYCESWNQWIPTCGPKPPKGHKIPNLWHTGYEDKCILLILIQQIVCLFLLFSLIFSLCFWKYWIVLWIQDFKNDQIQLFFRKIILKKPKKSFQWKILKLFDWESFSHWGWIKMTEAAVLASQSSILTILSVRTQTIKFIQFEWFVFNLNLTAFISKDTVKDDKITFRHAGKYLKYLISDQTMRPDWIKMCTEHFSQNAIIFLCRPPVRLHLLPMTHSLMGFHGYTPVYLTN